MSDSQLLHFAYADFEEERRNYENAKKIYDKLIEREHVDPTLVGLASLAFSNKWLMARNLDLHSIDEVHAEDRRHKCSPEGVQEGDD